MEKKIVTLPRLPLSYPLVVASIIGIAAFVRLWNLPLNFMFYGDQGRDALIVSRIFTEGDLVFIGPVTSVGNMYLGPLYYYFMLPWLWLSYPSPIGPVYAIAILAIITVALVYYWGKDLVGKRAAVIASALLAVAAIPITYSRFSWNPNPAPFVSLLLIMGIYRAITKNPRWWALAGLCVAILIQLHYLAALAGLGAAVLWLGHAYFLFIKDRAIKNLSPQRLQFIQGTLIALVIFLASLVPLLLFDYKHDWLNFKALNNIAVKEEAFTAKESSFVTQVAMVARETHGRSLHILFEYTLGKNRAVNTALTLLVLTVLTWRLTFIQDNKYRVGETIIFVFLVTGVIGTAFYRHTVFDHYIAYLFPVTFLIYGVVLSHLWQTKWGKIMTAAFVATFLVYNLPRLPLPASAWNTYDMRRVTQSIYDHLQPGEQYGLVLLSPTKDLTGQNYRYFLSTTDRPALDPEEAVSAGTLVVINEDGIKDVASSPIYDIVVFPEKSRPEVYTIPGGPEVLIYRK